MQRRDPELAAVTDFLENDILPTTVKMHARFYSQAIIFILVKMVCFTTLILIEGEMLVNLFLSLLSQLHYVLKSSLMYMIKLPVLILASTKLSVNLSKDTGGKVCLKM